MPAQPRYQTVSVADRRTGSPIRIFYREAGDKGAPVVLLLHGFPSSSHQFRGLIGRLSDKYRVIAPDLPGFGFSDAPDARSFEYSFDHLADVIESFTDTLGLTRYALYVFDYERQLASASRLRGRSASPSSCARRSPRSWSPR